MRTAGRTTEINHIKAAVRSRDGGCVACRETNEQHKARTGRQLDVHREVPGSRYTVEGCKAYCIDCHPRDVCRAPGEPDLDAPATTAERFIFLLSPALRDRAEKQATRFGMTASAYIRLGATEKLERDEGGPPKESSSRTGP